MKTLTEQYPKFKKRDAVISKKARDFIGEMAKEGYNVAQMQNAIEQARHYIDVEISNSFINEPKKLYCGYAAHWEIDEDGNKKSNEEPPTAATGGSRKERRKDHGRI